MFFVDHKMAFFKKCTVYIIFLSTSGGYNAVSKFEHVFVGFFLLLNKSQDISAFYLRMSDHVVY